MDRDRAASRTGRPDSRSGAPLLAAVLAILAAAVVLVSVQAAVAEPITSTFDVEPDAWTVIDESTGEVYLPEYLDEGGNPDGHATATSAPAQGTWYWSAPDEYLGNVSAHHGSVLSFDLKQNRTEEQYGTSDVLLHGEEVTIVWHFDGASSHPGTDWTSFEVPIDDGEGWVRQDDGEPVTADELDGILTSLTGLWIRGEYAFAPNRGGLDNVRLGPVEDGTDDDDTGDDDGDPPPGELDGEEDPAEDGEGEQPVEPSLPEGGTNITLDPTRTYLRTHEDEAADARPVPLADLGVRPGDEVRLTRLGTYLDGEATGRGLAAVFSTSTVLHESDRVHRVADAAAAGFDVNTSATVVGDRWTDIPEDLLVADRDGDRRSTVVQVPAGATHLFATALDDRFEDNADPDGDFGVHVALHRPADVPIEPSEVHPSTRQPSTSERTETRTYDIDWPVDHTIPFKSGTVTLEQGLGPALEAAEGRAWVVLQFEETQPYRRLGNLTEYDIVPAGNLTRTAIYAGVPAESLADLAGEDAVRSVAKIRPEWKQGPSIEAAVDREELGPETEVSILLRSFEPFEDPRLEGRSSVPNVYLGNLTLTDVEELADHPKVEWIWRLAKPVATTSESLSVVGGSTRQQHTPIAYRGGGATWLGHYTGKGVRVGIVDSGIEPKHPHFASNKVILGRNFLAAAPATGAAIIPPKDTDGHGTHVAGTVAGWTDPSAGNFDAASGTASNLRLQGVARDAELVIVRAIDANLKMLIKNLGMPVKKFFNEIIDHGEVEVINNSWGWPWSIKGADNIATRKADKWARNHPGTLVVFSNGNAPDDEYTNPLARGVNVLTVSAVWDGSTDSLAGGEQMKPQTVTRDEAKKTAETSPLLTKMKTPRAIKKGVDQIKPELLAPGEGIHAPTINSKYGIKRGTSMAAPHVTGVAAVVQEALPFDPSADELRAALVNTATPSKGGSGSYYTDGFGVVNAHDAAFLNTYEHKYSFFSPFREGASGKGVMKKNAHLTTFQVPEGAKEVSASLSWLDPGKHPATRVMLSNNLWLFVGPKDKMPRAGQSDPEAWSASGIDPYVNTAERNVKRIQIHDPEPGTWAIGVYGRYVTAFTHQKYAVVYDVEMENPRYDAKALPDSLKLRGGEQATVLVDVEGTGSATGAVAGWLEDTSDGIEPCKGEPAWVIGSLSKGRKSRVKLCLEAKPGARVGKGHYADLRFSAPEWGVVEEIEIEVQESQPPSKVGSLRSPSHQRHIDQGTWSRRPKVVYEWDPAIDTGSGVHRYAFNVSTKQDSVPGPYGDPPGNNKVAGRGAASTHSIQWMGPPSAPQIPAPFKQWTKQTPDLLEGEYWFHVRAFDEAGNSLAQRTEHLGPVKIDLSEPNVVVEAPPAAQAGQNVTIDVSKSTDPPVDAPGDLQNFLWRLGNDAKRAPGPTLDHVWEKPGTYTIKVRGVDAAGNFGFAETKIKIIPKTTPGPGGVAVLVAAAGALWLLGRWDRA